MRDAWPSPASSGWARSSSRTSACRSTRSPRSSATSPWWPSGPTTLVPVIGHAGDGNFHPLVTFDPADPAAVERAERAFDDIIEVALGLGGTITGEHGVGSLKARHLAGQLGPDVLELTRTIKGALDPGGILNPGKWV